MRVPKMVVCAKIKVTLSFVSHECVTEKNESV